MNIKPHLVRTYHQSKKVPLWKWVVIIVLVVAMPLFYSFVRMQQMRQALGNSNVQEVKVLNKT